MLLGVRRCCNLLGMSGRDKVGRDQARVCLHISSTRLLILTQYEKELAQECLGEQTRKCDGHISFFGKKKY